MLEFFFRPLRAALGVAEHEIAAPLAGPEHEFVHAVSAIRTATESIEHHVEVIEGLATAVGPLTDSVNHLTATMAELVTLLAPMGQVEREVGKVERFFGFRHGEPEPGSKPPEP